MSTDSKKVGMPAVVTLDQFRVARDESEKRAAEVGELQAKVKRRDSEIGQLKDQLRQAEDKALAIRKELEAQMQALRDEMVWIRSRSESNVAMAKQAADAEARAEIDRAKTEMQDVIEGARAEFEERHHDEVSALKDEIESRKAEMAEIHRRLCNGIAAGEGVYWANKADLLHRQLEQAEARITELSAVVTRLRVAEADVIAEVPIIVTRSIGEGGEDV
ncbi:MAG: hypothetical protein WC654_06685 [Patescibacteria group bacterium]